MDALPTTTTITQPTRVWAISLAVLCGGAAAYRSIFSINETKDIAFLFGYNLSMGVMIWAIFHAIVGRGAGAKKAWFSFSAIFAALLTGSLVGMWQQKDDSSKAITEIQKSISHITSAANDANGMPQHVDTNLDITPKTKGYWGEIERFLKILMQKAATQRNDYLSELDTIGWEKILDPGRISQDKALRESKMMLQKASLVAHKYRTQTNVLLANARNEIISFNMNESAKRDLLKGFDNGLAESKMDSLWDLEENSVVEVGKIIELLSLRKDFWTVKNGKFVFSNRSDLEAFRSHISKVQEYANKQQAIQKNNLEKATKLLNASK